MHQKGEQPAMPFEFEGAAVRVVKIDGEPWFVAKDVCDVLGYGNPSQALASHVDCDDLQKLEAIDSRGRKQLTNYINEPGLYALILCSEKQKAREFKKWVTGTVLPAIRKDGAYIMGEEKVATGEHSREQLLSASADDRRRRCDVTVPMISQRAPESSRRHPGAAGRTVAAR